MRTPSGITVVLLNWNALADTGKCLKRLLGWTRLRPDIFVVDNGSTDGSAAEISRCFPQITLLRNSENRGFAGGNNVAFRRILQSMTGHGEDSAVLLLNSDACIEEGCVALLLDTLTREPDVGIVGPLLFADSCYGQLLSAGGLDPATSGATYWNGPSAEQFLQQHGKVLYTVAYVSGTVALLRGSLLRDAGLFDEQYFFSCEMADWCERIKTFRYRCVVQPQARAWHDMDPGGKPRNTLYLYYSLRNRFLFIRKWRRHRRTGLFAYWILAGAKGIARHLLHRETASARALFLALRDGISGQFGGRNELFM